jgi:hypothetical protein
MLTVNEKLDTYKQKFLILIYFVVSTYSQIGMLK